MSKGKNGAPARGSLGRNRMLRFRAWKGFYGRKRNILLRGWLPWPVRAHRRVAGPRLRVPRHQDVVRDAGRGHRTAPRLHSASPGTVIRTS